MAALGGETGPGSGVIREVCGPPAGGFAPAPACHCTGSCRTDAGAAGGPFLQQEGLAKERRWPPIATTW